jgi:copper chaperone
MSAHLPRRSLTLQITGMHCASCAMLVDDCIEDLDDVVSSHTDLRSGRCVTVVGNALSDAAVVAAIAGAGYAATLLETAPEPTCGGRG